MRGYKSQYRFKMPLVAYFAVATPCLLGLLFVTEAAPDPIIQPKKNAAAPLVLPGSAVRRPISAPILTFREAPEPPAWILALNEKPVPPHQAKSQKKQGKAAKIASRQNKKTGHSAQAQRNRERYMRAAVPGHHIKLVTKSKTFTKSHGRAVAASHKCQKPSCPQARYQVALKVKAGVPRKSQGGR
jgi:hypothetical protein